MEKQRFIFSSAEKRKTPNLQMRKKKKAKLADNSSLENIAKVYLQNPKILPKT